MSLLEQFRISIGDFRSYRRLATQGFGRSFTFLICLVTLVFLISGSQLALGFREIATQGLDYVRNQVPDFHVTDGKLVVDAPMPYRFEADDSLIIVDTTGGTSPDAISAYPQAVLIDAERIIIKDTSQTRMIYFTELGADGFTKADVLTLIDSLDWLLGVFAVGYYIWLVISKLLAVFLLSLGALIINSSLRTNLNYQQLWNVSLYASVVPTLVSVLIGLVGGLNGIGVIAYWGLGLFYVASALRAGTAAVSPAPPAEPPIEPPAA